MVKFFSKKNYYILITFFLIISFFFYSIYTYRFIFDSHHHGLVFSNALDLLNGKKPYQEIYIKYGILTVFLHSIILKIAGVNLFFINVFTIAIYSLSIFFIFIIISRFVNYFYGFLGSFIILLNHPIIWLPWANYLSYFFILFAIYVYSNNRNFNQLIIE